MNGLPDRTERARILQQRTSGEARLVYKSNQGQTKLADLYQQGAAKIRFPTVAGSVAHAVIINTGGGLTGGDRFAVSIALQADAQAVIATQACEKIYRSSEGSAIIESHIMLAQKSSCHWLPQETILFDGADLHRQLRIAMDASATLLAVESLIFGRSAHGERLKNLILHDSIAIRRDGRLIYADALRLEDVALWQRKALGAGASMMATCLYVAPDAEQRLEEARLLIAACACEATVSAWNGILAFRFLAREASILRRDLIVVLEAWRGAALPRSWTL